MNDWLDGSHPFDPRNPDEELKPGTYVIQVYACSDLRPLTPAEIDQLLHWLDESDEDA